MNGSGKPMEAIVFDLVALGMGFERACRKAEAAIAERRRTMRFMDEMRTDLLLRKVAEEFADGEGEDE